MKISENWLRSWIDPKISTADLVAQLTMAGLEVDAVEPACKAFDKVVVAEIKSVEPHPDADKLKVCQVDFGNGSLAQIVCGAPNAIAGIKVPMACVGAKLAEDFTIKKAKLRGVDSAGMLCGASEIGLEDKVDGLLVLPEDAPIGQSIRDYLQLDDQIIDIDLTPNRGDCLSLRGLSREVAVLNNLVFEQPNIDKVPAVIDDTFPVALNAVEGCPRYWGRVIKNVDLSIPSPLWLIEKLRRSGIRSIDPVVDVTNYIMLELGQPMHAFDLDTLNEGIQVRFASPNEEITLLDGQKINLSEDNMVIADTHNALALAGIMGCENSGVSLTTQNIFLESAFFDPLVIAGKARSFGLHTDSSHRFERGVDPILAEKAIERATSLILSIVGGQAGPSVKTEALPFSPLQIQLETEKVNQLLGIEVAASEIERILVGLDIVVATKNNGFICTIPSHRFDLNIAEDLIEEIARIIGYDKLPVQPLVLPAKFTLEPEKSTDELTLKRLLAARGYQETITYSFISPKLQAAFDDEVGVNIQNPISSDLSVMRTSLVPGLINTLQHNLNRQQQRVSIFETGLIFKKAKEEIIQQPMLAGLIYGTRYPSSWNQSVDKVDFYDVKADVEALLEACNLSNISFNPINIKGFHPGQTAGIFNQDQQVGYVGAIHPEFRKKFSLKQSVFVFQLSLDILKLGKVANFEPVSKFPSTRRDLAFIVDQSINAIQLQTLIREVSGDLLQSCFCFDVYQGTEMNQNEKSLAIALIFQHQDRSLEDQEIQHIVDTLIEQAKVRLGAIVRK